MVRRSVDALDPRRALLAALAALTLIACTVAPDDSLSGLDAVGGGADVPVSDGALPGDGVDKGDADPDGQLPPDDAVAPDDTGTPGEAVGPGDVAPDDGGLVLVDTAGDAAPDAPADAGVDLSDPGMQAAIQACEGRAEGDACTLTFPGQTVDGACVVFQGVLACSMTATPNPPDNPHEASVQACAGKAGGDDCQFTFDGQTTTGTCEQVQGELQCRPQDGPGPGGGGLPPEALDACAGKDEGDACSATVMGQDYDGTCTTVQGQLVCAPEGGNPGGGGGDWIPQEAVDACAGKQAGDACSATAWGQSYDGACGDVFGTFACAPDWMGGGGNPGGGGQTDPCAGKAEGDACTATMMGQTYDGTCKTVWGQFTCSPSWMPGG